MTSESSFGNRQWSARGRWTGGRVQVRVGPGLHRDRVERLDVDVAILGVGLADGGGEALADVVRDLDAGLAREDPDVADRVLGDAAAPAQERDQPFRIGVLRAADVDREPDELARVVAA